MKRSTKQSLSRGMLAVPAAALMLGAAEAGTTVGLNFQSWYYDSGATPQTVGFGSGYQTTGFPVTAKAFGVNVADWTNTNPIDINVPAVVTGIPFAGLLVDINATNLWESGYTGPGTTYASFGEWPPGSVIKANMTPGDYEVAWSFLDNTGWSFSVSGLNAKFPNGYMVGLIGGAKITTTSSVKITENAGNSTVGTVTFKLLPDNMGIGASPVLANDSITFTNASRPALENCAVAGLIVTDKPVATSCLPATTAIAAGASFTLTGTALGVGTLTYQWKHDGNNVGTNSPTYTVNTASPTDSGDYVLVVTSNLYPGEPATSKTVQVTVAVPATVTWDADTGTAGAQDGSGTWNASNTNWWNGTADVAWSSLNPAVFGNGGTGPYTVTLASSVTASGGLTFNSGTYTVAPAAAETLTLSGTATIHTLADATIGVKLNGSSGFTKQGTGRLTLTNNGNALTGPVVVSAGTLDVSHGSGGTSLTVNSGASAITTATNAIGYSSDCYTLNVIGGTFTLGALNDGVWAMNTTLDNATMTAITGARYSFGGGSQIANTGTSSFTGGSIVLREGNPDNTLPITNTGVLTINCPITGGNNISFAGSGTTTLAAANTYSGSTTVNAGKLVVSGQTNSSTTTVNAGTLFVSGQSNGSTTTVNAGTLEVSGKITNTGTIWLKDDTALKVTASGGTPALSTTGTMNVGTDYQVPAGMNNLTFNSLSSNSVAPVTVGILFLDSPVTIHIGSVNPLVGQYPLMKFTGSTVSPPHSLTLGTLPGGITATLVDDTAGPTQSIYLNVTAVTVPNALWTGVPNSLWDINGTSNWTVGGSPAKYLEGNVVTFDDTAINTSVTLNTAVNPSVVTFNNPTKNYTLGGSGAIAGATSLTKDGAGTLTISNANTYSGVTTVSGGTLVLLDAGASPLSAGIVDNAALEINTTSGPRTYNSSITGTGTLTKTGPDTLTITGGLALTTPVTVAAGTLVMQTRSTDAPYVVNSGGTLKIGYSTGGGYANTNLKIHGDGAAATTGLYLKGGTTYNVSGSVELLDAPTTIRQYDTGFANMGIFDINSVGLTCTPAASGSATDANVKFVSYGYGMRVDIETGAATATGDFILNGPLDVDHVGNGFYKRGTGSLRLNAAATANNRNVRILAGTVICGIAECLGTNAALQINAGGSLALNGFNQTVKVLYFGNAQQAAGTWGATGSGATHIDNTRFSGTGVVSVTTAPPDFSAWATVNAPGQTASQDHDGDGVSNGIEYFMGQTGSTFTANPAVTSGKVSWPKGTSYAGVYGVDYWVQTSPDLSTWTDVLIGDPNLSNAGPLEYTLPVGNPEIFTRLKVTGP